MCSCFTKCTEREVKETWRAVDMPLGSTRCGQDERSDKNGANVTKTFYATFEGAHLGPLAVYFTRIFGEMCICSSKTEG
jgi:hypothetical protein